MKTLCRLFVLFFFVFVNSGCAALWFGGGVATGVVAHEALDDDQKVVVAEKESNES